MPPLVPFLDSAQTVLGDHRFQAPHGRVVVNAVGQALNERRILTVHLLEDGMLLGSHLFSAVGDIQPQRIHAIYRVIAA